jgi:hypothetical protein
VLLLSLLLLLSFLSLLLFLDLLEVTHLLGLDTLSLGLPFQCFMLLLEMIVAVLAVFRGLYP